MSRYTDEDLIKHAFLTETQLVRAVYPDCPTSEMDSERSAVRTARAGLIQRMVVERASLLSELSQEHQKTIALQSEVGALEGNLHKASLMLGYEREHRRKDAAELATERKRAGYAMQFVSAAHNALIDFLTFGGGLPWVLVRSIGGKSYIVRTLDALASAIDYYEGRKK